ncbi:hypothetical protein DITRI_Ditri14bG0038600 [Diplodiscus trichospermus]
MAGLTKEQLLKDKHTHDPLSITSLSLDHKALSDVSCLAEFKNLERLDLAFNNLTSLQGLKCCINLKWLSVVLNKLQNLKGIEGLTKLTVLNAGKNKIRSMEEVKSLVNLRALILNDNEIVSICGLDEMKDLNTLVLSRNPISEIGNSLAKLKSITKFSASNCQIQAIDSSLKCCIELKELRLAHNDIKVKKLLPNLHIFNARPIDKCIKNKIDEIVGIASNNAINKEDIHTEEKKDPKMPGSVEKQVNLDAEKELKRKRKKGNDELSTEVRVNEEDHIIVEKGEKKKKAKGEQENLSHLGVEKKFKEKGRKTNDKVLNKEASVQEDGIMAEEKPKKKKLEKRAELDIIDDAGASFIELLATDVANQKYDGKRNIVDRADQDMKLPGSLVTYPVKKKKNKHAVPPELQLSPAVEVGRGGVSTWDDE